MAKTSDISDIVKKSKVLLLDVEGTTTSISFVKDQLFPYVEKNVKEFLDTHWDKEDVKEGVAALRKLALEDQEKSLEGIVLIPGEDSTKDEQIEGIVNNVKWQMSSDRKAGALKQLQGLIWKQGYNNGDIKGHVFDDVPPALEQWKSVEKQKIYIYSSGSVQAQKLLFGQSVSGNLLTFIDGHYDTAVGAKQESSSYVNITTKIGCKPEEILFLTDIVKEAEAAKQTGLNVALVKREGNAPLPNDIEATYPVLHTFAGLSSSNKRKTQEQNEQPAKIAKCSSSDDVKTNSADNAQEMEVDTALTETDKSTKTNSREKVVIEEITDSNEAVGAVVCDIEPIVIEEKVVLETIHEKPETSEESHKVEMTKKKDNNDSKPTEIEIKKSVTVIEIISEKQSLDDVADVLEDSKPVVEEPDSANEKEMDELKHVGDVLEKECDEILSKVNNVTNLDNIAVKPILNQIVEEKMETDNGDIVDRIIEENMETDNGDIVDRILDTESEMEKQCKEVSVVPVQDDKKNGVKMDNEKDDVTASDSGQKEKDKNKPLENTEQTKIVEEVKEKKKEKLLEEKEDKPLEEKESKTIKEKDKPLKEKDELKVKGDEKKLSEKEEIPLKEKDDPLKEMENKPLEEKEDKPLDEKEDKALDEKEDKPLDEKEDKPLNKKDKPLKDEVDNKQIEEKEVNAQEKKEEIQINGNSKIEANVNGDANNDVNSRLTEDGNEVVNGTNEKKETVKEIDTDMSDIKVKTLASETHTDPAEQIAEV